MFNERVISFYSQLKIQASLPKGIRVMNPYLNPSTLSICKKFYQKYYSDDRPRVLLLGINPGRFGSGTTGISFTDPIRLQNVCGIENPFPKKPELSSDFIYKMINAFGGPEKFYASYFISAVSPLGFTKDGKNINYYDDRKLEKAVTPFIIESFNNLMDLGIHKEKCYCVGEGKNFNFLKTMNEKHKWFKEIIPLSHPRFIMQYKRKRVQEYVNEYVRLLASSPALLLGGEGSPPLRPGEGLGVR